MMPDLFDALLLRAGYNAALVAIGAATLGFSAGAAGCFLVLRKRALVADAMAHATLPGLALGFLGSLLAGSDGRTLLALLLGAAISAFIAVVAIDGLTRRTRLPEDAAIGAVLSSAFGFGIVLLTLIQSIPGGKPAGLQGFLLGSTAGMLLADAITIACGSILTVVMLFLLRRPLTLLTFDPGFASVSGYPIRALDLALLLLIGAITLIGLKIVGLVLIVALLITPASAARFWSDHLGRVVGIAGGIGAVSAYLGTAISAAVPGMPTGPVIVLISFLIFLLSLVVAPSRGLLPVWLRRRPG